MFYGNNMNFMNPFQMFSMGTCGFGSCNYSLGAQMGYTFANMGMSIFGAVLSSRMSGGSDSSSGSSSQLATIEQDMQAQIKILNKDGKYAFTLKNLPTTEPSVESIYDDKINKANTAIDAKKTDILNLTKEIDDLENGSKALKNPTKEEYTKDGVFDEKAYDKALGDYLEQQRQIKAKKDQLKKWEESIEETGELGKALKAAKDAKTARAEEIHTAYAKLKQLELDRQAEIENNADNIIDAGDGNGTSRLLSPNKRKVHAFLEAKREYVKLKNPTKADYSKLKDTVDALPRDSKRTSTLTAIQYADAWFKNIQEPKE